MKPQIAALIALLTYPAPAGTQAGHAERHATLPAVSPNGRWIAYVRDKSPDSTELRVVGVDGSKDRLLRGAGPHGVPGWGDGGRRVTLVQSSGDSATLWSIGLDGRDARVLARLQGHALSPSNNGRLLAYATGDWRHNRLTVSDFDGGHIRVLTDSSAAWFNIAWSPDDRMLAASRLDSTADMQVWLVEVQSAQPRPLTAFASAEGRPQWPAWSPDGKRVAVQAGHYDREHPEKNESDIWVIEMASGRATKVGMRTGTWMDETPSWCADGRRIVFQSSRTGRFELWSAKVDGGKARMVTR